MPISPTPPAARLVLGRGVYRAGVSALTWDAGRARDTLLVLEGTLGLRARSVRRGAEVPSCQGGRLRFSVSPAQKTIWYAIETP